MPDSPQQATQWATVATLVVTSLVTVWVAWLNRKGASESTLAANQQHSLTSLLTGLQAQVDDLQQDNRDLRAEMKEVRAENAECLADRDQMRGELRRVTNELLNLKRDKEDKR